MAKTLSVPREDFGKLTSMKENTTIKLDFPCEKCNEETLHHIKKKGAKELMKRLKIQDKFIVGGVAFLFLLLFLWGISSSGDLLVLAGPFIVFLGIPSLLNYENKRALSKLHFDAVCTVCSHKRSFNIDKNISF